jgi:hypothetical protein
MQCTLRTKQEHHGGQSMRHISSLLVLPGLIGVVQGLGYLGHSVLPLATANATPSAFETRSLAAAPEMNTFVQLQPLTAHCSLLPAHVVTTLTPTRPSRPSRRHERHGN